MVCLQNGPFHLLQTIIHVTNIFQEAFYIFQFQHTHNGRNVNNYQIATERFYFEMQTVVRLVDWQLTVTAILIACVKCKLSLQYTQQQVYLFLCVVVIIPWNVIPSTSFYRINWYFNWLPSPIAYYFIILVPFWQLDGGAIATHQLKCVSYISTSGFRESQTLFNQSHPNWCVMFTEPPLLLLIIGRCK